MSLISFFSGDSEINIDSWMDLPDRFKARLESRQVNPLCAIDPANPKAPFGYVSEFSTVENVPMLGQSVPFDQAVALFSSQSTIVRDGNDEGTVNLISVSLLQFEKFFKPTDDRGKFFELKKPGQLLVLNEGEEIEPTGQEEIFGTPDSLFFIGDDDDYRTVFTWSPQQRVDFLI